MQINSVHSEAPVQTLVSAAQQHKTAPPVASTAPQASESEASVSLSSTSSRQTVSSDAHVSSFQTSGFATVSGKNYPESIQESQGVIIASVPNPPGATATGSSVESAEYNLQVKLDTLA